MSAVEELVTKLLLPARLLLVESDKRQADALRQQIQAQYECAVDWAGCGLEAQHRLGQNKYDLLLLASTPQDVSVREFLRQVKATAPAVPVILVTGFPGTFVAEEAAACGIVSVLTRPVSQGDIDDLFRVFKVRVRSKEDTRHFQSRNGLRPVAA